MAKIKKDPSTSLGQDKKSLAEKDFGEISIDKIPAETPEKLEEIQEKKEIFNKEEIQKLRDKIENMDLDDSLKKHIQANAQNIISLSDEKKIKNLLKIAKEKGIVYAVKVAKNMNNPYILDMLHDILAEKGFYKKFMK